MWARCVFTVLLPWTADGTEDLLRRGVLPAKAYTAAAFGTPTSELAKRVNRNGPSIADLPGTLFLAGGVPLKVNGVSVAGVGVGGAPDGALDEACATAGAEATAAGTGQQVLSHHSTTHPGGRPGPE